MFGLEDELQSEIAKLTDKNRKLEGLILTWRQKLKKDLDIFEQVPYKYAPEYLEEFDKHFGIIIERDGKTKN